MNKNIVILGAGLSGLVAGRALSKNNQVVILEKKSFYGGLASSFKMGDDLIPRFYHHIIASNNLTMDELDRFGLLSNTEWKKIKINVGQSGKIYNLQNPVDFIRMPGMSLWAKFRLICFGIYSLHLMNPEKIPADQDAQEFLYKFCGKTATDFFWRNLYERNKFNTPLSQISAKQFAHRLHEKEIYDLFTYPPTGLQFMIDGIMKEFSDSGGTIRLNTAPEHINLKTKTITLSSGEIMDYDVLINSIPAPELLKITKGFPDDYKSKLERIRFCPAVGICFATKEFLEKDIYWINLFNEAVNVVIQHSVMIDKYKDKVSWLIRYGGSEYDLDKSEDEIKKIYFDTIGKYFPDSEIVWARVFKEQYAEPIYDKTYYDYAPDYNTPVDGLYMTGMQVTFPKIRNQSTAIESGFKVAEIVKSDL